MPRRLPNSNQLEVPSDPEKPSDRARTGRRRDLERTNTSPPDEKTTRCEIDQAQGEWIATHLPFRRRPKKVWFTPHDERGTSRDG
ncbi:unnamed protein product [Trichogramma brassicae]|uniref:Uncharacterized protein n=1 Tax=Trichogramma brassicae TaxID=86971 RepID=A0A6H5INF1_9HYME|nr:unnamed protein product [Trichogramma brassicae]